MFVRVKKSGSKEHPHDYLQIVESYRKGGIPNQRVIATLGRVEHLKASGQIDALIQSLARFSDSLRIISAARDPKINSCRSRIWGTALVFDRLWQKQHLPGIINKLSEGRRFGFDIERALFALALQRLCHPGSDLQGSQWIQHIECPGLDQLELQHLYRTNSFLADVREELEHELFMHDRDLFSGQLDLVMLDTTSIYTYRNHCSELCRRGYSRDRRPDLPQYVLALAVDHKGWPVSWQVLAGNTADKTAFSRMLDKLRKRFGIEQVTIVGDRGMCSAQGLQSLQGDDGDAPFDYILGCRMRRQKEVNEQVLSRAGRFHRVDANLEVKEVCIEDRRYIVCFNPEEARKDEASRQAILDKLAEIIARKGPKALVGNKGYARFLSVTKGAVRIDPEAIEADRRLDGKFVLTTNTQLSSSEVALSYKGLWRVERAFREQKSTLEIRPLYHRADQNSIGHITAGFLALRLQLDLKDRLVEKGIETSWPDLMGDLSRLQAVRMDLDGRSYLIRTDFEGAAYQAFQTVGLRPPARVTSV
jgi:hypothetical protein